jgi:hypothetical protein
VPNSSSEIEIVGKKAMRTGMIPFRLHRAGMALELKAVEEHEDRENRDRGAENELRNSRR